MLGHQKNEDFANFCAGANEAPGAAFARERQLSEAIYEAMGDLYGRFTEMGYPVCGITGAHTVGAAIFDWVRQTGRGEIENCITLGQLDAQSVGAREHANA